jgi:polyphosphate kinase
MTPAGTLDAIRARVLPMMHEQRRYWHEEVRPQLAANGIRIMRCDEAGPEACDGLREYYQREIHPSLTPLAHDPGRPFPYISNLSLSLAVTVRDGRGTHFARSRCPTPSCLISLDLMAPLMTTHPDGVAGGCHRSQRRALFPRLRCAPGLPFRDPHTDMEIQEDEASDLPGDDRAGLRQRQFGPVVQLMVDEQMPSIW